MDSSHRPRRQWPTAGPTGRQQSTVECIEVGRLELRQRPHPQRRHQRAVDVALRLLDRLRREVRSGELDPCRQQLPHRRRRPNRQATFGLGDHFGERSLRLALGAAHGSRRVTLLAGEWIVTEVDPQVPRRPSLPHEALHPILPSKRLASDRQPAQKTRRATPKSGFDLVFYWQPQRDSNPCRHLERVVS